MKTPLILAAVLILTGCTTNKVYNQGSDQSQVEAGPNYFGSGYAIVNNTPYRLAIVQDGREVASHVKPGQVLPLKALWLKRISTVVVLAYNPAGVYIGTDRYVFSGAVPETWTVSEVIPQGGGW